VVTWELKQLQMGCQRVFSIMGVGILTWGHIEQFHVVMWHLKGLRMVFYSGVGAVGTREVGMEVLRAGKLTWGCFEL
jgi:hypothetical protein